MTTAIRFPLIMVTVPEPSCVRAAVQRFPALNQLTVQTQNRRNIRWLCIQIDQPSRAVRLILYQLPIIGGIHIPGPYDFGGIHIKDRFRSTDPQDPVLVNREHSPVEYRNAVPVETRNERSFVG
jgi:hypothetical protein